MYCSTCYHVLDVQKIKELVISWKLECFLLTKGEYFNLGRIHFAVIAKYFARIAAFIIGCTFVSIVHFDAIAMMCLHQYDAAPAMLVQIS